MVTVFSNAAVFDGTRFIPGRRDVVVDGSQITAITEAGQAPTTPATPSSTAPSAPSSPASSTATSTS